MSLKTITIKIDNDRFDEIQMKCKSSNFKVSEFYKKLLLLGLIKFEEIKQFSNGNR